MIYVYISIYTKDRPKPHELRIIVRDFPTLLIRDEFPTFLWPNINSMDFYAHVGTFISSR